MNRHVKDYLEHERRKVCLDDLPPSLFTAQPSQEGNVWKEEQMELLKKVVKRLTKRQQQLFGLLENGLSERDIALGIGVKVEAIYQAKSRLIKKLQRLMLEIEGER